MQTDSSSIRRRHDSDFLHPTFDQTPPASPSENTQKIRTPNKKTSYAGLWSRNSAKAEGEQFFLMYAVFWVGLMAVIVISGMYERFTEWSYLYVGLLVGVPPVILPLFFPSTFVGEEEARLYWTKRYTTKANLWIAILSFIGNYVWTHYFYVVLQTDYTFPSHRLNNVPIACYLLTHSYFLLYHGGSNIALRWLWGNLEEMSSATSYCIVAVSIFVMASITAFTETFTIQQFPYYSYPSKYNMFVYGSVFYGIYFWFSYPMYYRIDEGRKWTLKETALDSFACCMMVTLVLDFWRLLIGNINQNTEGIATPGGGMPFVY
eukprot:gb/GEZN01009992.1/.p1 GENE.gb/GEZN01009992.1/~~gb/GEZN01009992.1/.p1  ORF type:complete len:319 (-),score=15.11 gb/GEZN01009992.1/:215-1171(-)